MAGSKNDIASSSCSSAVDAESETRGFDRSAGNKWIYPENYPRREYQFSIAQTALFNNTLVCLPTGLGKTFIAAVVMYNFWRWYPMGRVVFMAPTKPLVAQQINACHEIMGIPSDQTIELTGAIVQTKRRQAWKQYRVIFATPQTFQKDLQNEIVPVDLIKCVVIDEAHKALGKHSYCEIVRMLNEKTKFFRILALSATPGSKIDHVREVIQNLLISELELRDDTSPDVIPYTNDRSLEKIIVGLDKEHREIKDRYVNIMDPHVRILIKNHILQGSTANISKGRIFMLMKQYESRPQKANNHGTIMKTLNILLTMYHAYELLVKHGLRAFYNFYLTHSDKFWMDGELDLKLLLENIKHYLGDFPVIQSLPDGTIPEIPDHVIFGHNKFYKLRELLEEHFRSFASQNKSTRAIVFVEYRDIVNEVYVLLLQNRPLIRPQMFVGQAGQKQKDQLAALEDFRNNQVNVLISTSVGEEGLDVGEVDLIVCFDISSSTPTRLVQRMGRTGRKRSGRVVLLLTEGKEVQTLQQAMFKKDSMNSKILQSSNIASSLYQSSPRMVPDDISPDCYTMFIKSLPKTPKPKLTSRGAKQSSTSETSEPKKPRKRKKNDVQESNADEPQPSTSKTQQSPKKAGGIQSSMMRFLKDPRHQSTSSQQHTNQKRPLASTSSTEDDSGIIILSQEFQRPSDPTDPYSIIRPSDVKLITSDELANEFLTLCAMKRSEPAEPEAFTIDSPYLRKPQSSYDLDIQEDPFAKLSVPSVNCLDFISKLTICDEQIALPDNDQDYDDFQDNEDLGFGDRSELVDLSDGEVVELVDELDDDRNRAVELEDGCFEVVESKYARRSRQLVPNEAPSPIKPVVSREASVEVDFEAILDDATEISSSSSVCHNEAVIPDSLLDELLDGDSSEDINNKGAAEEQEGNDDDDDDEEEDLFKDLSQSFSPDESKTLIAEPDADETLRPAPDAQLPNKRCASQSPCKDSPTKRQRLLTTCLPRGDSSDSDAVLGTPPKSKPRLDRSLLSRSVSFEPEAEPPTVIAAAPTTTTTTTKASTTTAVVYPDSDEDLFDDLDFETQFSPDKPTNEAEDDKDATFFEPDQDGNKDDDCIQVEKNTLNLEKRDVNIDQQTKVEERRERQEIERKEDKLKKSSNNKVIKELHCDLEFDDWDEFEIAPIICGPKPSVMQEKVSSFFAPKTKSTLTATTATTTTQQNVKKSQPLSSSGWISPGLPAKKSIFQQPKKPLSLKNLKPSNFVEKRTETDKKPPGSGNNQSYSTYRLESSVRPSLRLSSLKKSPPIDESKDKDGFLLPLQPVAKVTNEKENKQPYLAISTHRKESSVSPRFRRYHSESSLYSPSSSSVSRNRKKIKKRSKTARRRRLANEFIEEEADVSSDCDTSAGSSGDDDEDDTNDLSNFVSYTQVHEDEDMQAHYLQTINRSPIRPGAFIIKEARNPLPQIELYSQPVSQREDTYLHDSFCIGDETELADQDSNSPSNDTILENVDYNFENRRQRLNKKRKLVFKSFKNKRKQIKSSGKTSSSNSVTTNNSTSTSSSNSSEDETELLRKQIMEESMILKKSK